MTGIMGSRGRRFRCFEFLCCFTNQHMEYIFQLYLIEDCSVNCYKLIFKRVYVTRDVCFFFPSKSFDRGFTWEPVTLPPVSCYPALQKEMSLFVLAQDKQILHVLKCTHSATLLSPEVSQFIFSSEETHLLLLVIHSNQSQCL